MNLVNLLIQKGAMRDTDLPKVQEALRDAPNRPLHSVLMEKGFAKEEDVLPILGEQFGMEVSDLAKVTVDAETLRAMPAKLVHRRGMMPISRDNGRLVVATADPFDNADTFVAGHERRRGLHRPVAIRGVHVGVAQT